MRFRTVWRSAQRALSLSRPSSTFLRSASLRFESLEARALLSATPPTITEVAVASTQWTSGFYDHLEPAAPQVQQTDGYKLPTGSGAQTVPLPWENIDRIEIAFSEDVDIDAADISISGINSASYAFSGFYYNAQTFVASLTLDTPLPRDQYQIDIDADGLDPVVDLVGNLLDGEWVNNVSADDSGDGVAGGDFEFLFNVVPGDTDQNQLVNYYDYLYTRAREGATTSSPNYSQFHDIDGNGQIDTVDWMHVLGYLGTNLPAGQPVGVSNDAPTTAALSRVELSDPLVDEVLSLFAAFEDSEDADSQMTYSIVGNSDPSLLDTLSINPTTGELTLRAAANATGRTNITVQAEDSQGLTTETTFATDVNRTNLPPTIYDYVAEQDVGNTWLISGYVSDPDDQVEGWIVEFYGVFAARATVDENGYFEFAVILDPQATGFEWAITEDPWGLSSNNPARYIGLT